MVKRSLTGVNLPFQQVTIDPERLRALGIGFRDVAAAIRSSNSDVGGRVLEMGGREYYIRGRGYLQDLGDVSAIPVKVGNGGVPVRLGDIATIRFGGDIRRGLSEMSTRQPNARGERGAEHRRVAGRGQAATRRAAERPYVICHMAPAVDGRIVTRDWPLPAGLTAEYEATAAVLRGDAWIIGRVSMEPYTGKARLPAIRERLPRTDFIARADAQSYAIAIDPAGKLRWKSASIDQDHVVTVLTDRVPDRYLAFLRARGVSYLFGGRDHVDVQAVLRELRGQFGIRASSRPLSATSRARVGCRSSHARRG